MTPLRRLFPWLAFALMSLFAGNASAEVTFSLDKTTYSSTDAGIVASWTRAAGDPVLPKDWIGLYTPTQAPTSTSQSWRYLNGTKTAPATGVQSGSITLPMLPAGSYIARFFANDAWTPLAAEIPFTILPGGPNPPYFSVNPSVLRHALTGAAYPGCIRGYARDPDAGEVLSFSKVSGPSWLTIAQDGTLGGTPPAGSEGKAEFTAQVSDAAGHTATALFSFSVFAPGAEHVDRMNVMAYNLFHGWGQVNRGKEKGIESILLAGADIVCAVEATSGSSFRPQVIAQELGWYYAQIPSNSDVGVASRWPVQEVFQSGRAVGARIRLCENPLQEVIVYSTHLDYQHYTPYEAQRAGSTNASTLAEELASRRKTESEAMVAAMQSKLDDADHLPVIVAGDFNCPSHLDWTAAAASLHSGKVVAFPATVAMEQGGFIDSYRQMHPDPVAMPGNTWAPIYSAAEPQDRIDFIFHKGRKLKAMNSRVFVTTVETILTSYNTGGSIAGNTWPSDHAAVVTEYRLLPTDQNTNAIPDHWENRHFGDLQDDPDGNLLLAFAAGREPTDGAPVGILCFAAEGGSSGLSYLRRPGGIEDGFDYLAEGLRYRLWRSENLDTWLPANDWLTGDREVIAGDSDSEQLHLRVDLPEATPRQFFKLTVAPE